MTGLSAYIRNTIIAISILGLTFTGIANATTTSNSGSSATNSSAHHTAGRASHHVAHNNKTAKTNSVKHKAIKPSSTNHKLHKPGGSHKAHPIKQVTKRRTKIHSTHRHKSQIIKHKLAASKHTTKLQPVKPVITTQNQLQNNTLGEQNLSLNNLSMTQPIQGDGQRLASFVREIVSSLHYTRYASGGGTFDSKYGVYKLDCSHYVDNILHRVDPRAYASLETATGAETPSSANYYDFFTRLSSDIRHDWNRIDNAKELQPGDVLVFRYKNSSGVSEGGHVMVVMDKPVLDNDALLVQVSDSAAAGHSDDTRPAHISGVGIGTLLLKVDTYTGQPSAYAWEFNSPWKNKVDIAMARPLDFG